MNKDELLLNYLYFCNMIIKQKDKIREIKTNLLEQLKEENIFWSYAQESVTLDNLRDDQLIALTMRYLDLDEIKQLFSIFSFKKINSHLLRAQKQIKHFA